MERDHGGSCPAQWLRVLRAALSKNWKSHSGLSQPHLPAALPLALCLLYWKAEVLRPNPCSQGHLGAFKHPEIK